MLARGPDVEVAEAGLPNVLGRVVPEELTTTTSAAADLLQNLSGETLLHDLHNCRRSAPFRLSDER